MDVRIGCSLYGYVFLAFKQLIQLVGVAEPSDVLYMWLRCVGLMDSWFAPLEEITDSPLIEILPRTIDLLSRLEIAACLSFLIS
jgi:hypothetical protein